MLRSWQHFFLHISKKKKKKKGLFAIQKVSELKLVENTAADSTDSSVDQISYAISTFSCFSGGERAQVSHLWS